MISHDTFDRMREALRRGATPIGSAPRPLPDRVSMARNMARSTEIVGCMLDAIAEKRKVSQKPASIIIIFGRMCWALVEMSAPREFPNLLARYWIELLVLTEIVMIIVGTVIAGEKPIQTVGIQLLAVTMIAWFLLKLLTIYLDGRNVSWFIAISFLITVVFFVWLGVLHFTQVLWPAAQARMQHLLSH